MKNIPSFLCLESNGPVAAGQCVTITARPQVAVVKPYKCFIRPEFAKHFVIEDIRVGNRSMFPCGQRLDAEVFSHGDGHLFKCDPVMCSQDFLMVITNVSGQMSHFRADWAIQMPREMRAPARYSLGTSKPFDGPFSRSRSPKTYELEDTETRNIDDSLDAFEKQPASEKQSPVEHPPMAPDAGTSQAPERTQPIAKRRGPDHPGFGWDPGYGDD